MIRLLYIDLFCGAGGTSTGVESASCFNEPCAKVIACVNHDANAIASHAANHPDALHFTEDIRTLDLTDLIAHVEKMKLLYPDAYVVLWASLECTNFSKAKGGQPRDADSRTLAEHLFRYIEGINPDYIQIENVEEFMSWGDMDEKGKPLSKDKGRCYELWKRNVMRYGYDFDWRILNAADYGAYTTRKRFFGIFAKHNLPFAFPEPTHCKDGKKDMFGGLQSWKPVKEVLDFSDEGESIFCRKKPLAEKTLERIYAGLIKFVAGGKDAFIVKYNSMNRNGKYQAPGIDEPCPTVATQGRLALAKVNFLSKQFSGHPESKNISVDEPAGTITCKDHHAFVSAYYGNGHNHSVELPAPTITTKDRLALINTRFLCSYNFKDKAKDIELPCPTLLTKDRLSLVTPFFMNYYSGGGQLGSIETPSPAITTVPKQNLITPIIASNRKWHYLMNPQFASAGGSVDNPCFTLIARMDKMPPYLVEAEGGFGIKINDDDSPMTVLIKEFMAMYGIIDIKMRMLRISELKKIMGFPEDYKLIGTQADQKKFIGNAVEVNMARVLCEALCYKLDYIKRKTA
ncbi:DNA cytosine methyltransferase [Bacteroides caecigallinarum]|uniref:DNA cytosine methyltransferase n=1 Tax=Bacteroides caecigallinarum TaxID=1411144 RepID=UPI00195B4766|nr:DNA cytosine methyltransferase [Bacteroides caecigallinarum]MBM6866411.1 DNA cytosine methyltransferase [Bacteroides caecigallinarum]